MGWIVSISAVELTGAVIQTETSSLVETSRWTFGKVIIGVGISNFKYNDFRGVAMQIVTHIQLEN